MLRASDFGNFCLVWLSIELTFGYVPAQMAHPRISVKQTIQLYNSRVTEVAKSSKIAVDFTIPFIY